MFEMNIYSIGKIENKEDFVYIKLDSKFKDGLKGLKDFSHVQVLWWADKTDRITIIEDKPYKNGPDKRSTKMISHWRLQRFA